jgi:hypothetical protein
MHDPKIMHQEVIDRILWYLKGYPERWLLIEKNEHIRIEVYMDVDWVGCQDDRKSTSDHYAFVGENLIS